MRMAEVTMALRTFAPHALPYKHSNRSRLMGKRSPFSYERLEVYRTALEFAHVCSRLEDSLPRRRADLRDLLARESTNLIMKIARGSAEARQAAFQSFRQARRSAERCRSVLDGLRITLIGHQACVTAGIELLERIDAGLDELIRPLQKKLKSGPLPPLGQL